MNFLVINWISSCYKQAVKTSQHRYLCNNKYYHDVGYYDALCENVVNYEWLFLVSVIRDKILFSAICD